MESLNKESLLLFPEEISNEIPLYSEGTSEVNSGSNESFIYVHLFGVIGDWYITQISENRKKAYGYKLIKSEPVWEMDEWIKNCSEWGEINLEDLQNLVNNKFFKEKDIRFLIARDIYWEKKIFSSIEFNVPSLNYPGKSDRLS